jgi:Acetyl xylan esterase (AXE1)
VDRRGRPADRHSQGGGLAIAAAHLSGNVAAVIADVPFLAHPVRALEVTDSNPDNELAEYCKVNPDKAGQVFGTLAYLDVVNHAKRATAPALFSVVLADTITPPSTDDQTAARAPVPGGVSRHARARRPDRTLLLARPAPRGYRYISRASYTSTLPPPASTGQPSAFADASLSESAVTIE